MTYNYANNNKGIFSSSESTQTVSSTDDGLKITAKGGTVFLAKGNNQTIDFSQSKNVVIFSETGKIFQVTGNGQEDKNRNTVQKITGYFDKLHANDTGRFGIMAGIAGPSGAVIHNNAGIQFLGNAANDPAGTIRLISTESNAANKRGTAIFNFGSNVSNLGIQRIFMPVGQIGEANSPFVFGIVDVYGKEQYIHEIGSLYASDIGIASGTFSMTSDSGTQIIHSINSINIGNTNGSLGYGYGLHGIYNWSDSGAILDGNRHIGSQYVGITKNITVTSNNAENAFGINNRGGEQVIEAKPGNPDESVRISASAPKAQAFSVLVSPILSGTSSFDTFTFLKGNFSIDAGDILVQNNCAEGMCTSSSLYLVQDTRAAGNTLTLNDDVGIQIRKGQNDGDTLTTSLTLGDDHKQEDKGYNIRLGKNSYINDQGIFRGKGIVAAKFDKAAFKSAMALGDEGRGHGIVSGGVLLKNVEKTLGGSNSHLDVQIPITADDVPDEKEARKIMRSAVNNIFVNKGVENIRERIDLEKWEDEKGVYEKYKYVAGKVYINEGKISGGYEEEYYFDDPELVGNQNNIRDHLDDKAVLTMLPTNGAVTGENGVFVSMTPEGKQISLPLTSTGTTYRAIYKEVPEDPSENNKDPDTPGSGSDTNEEAGEGSGSMIIGPGTAKPLPPPKALAIQDGKLCLDGKPLTVDENGNFRDPDGKPVDVEVTTDNAKAIYAWEGEIGEKIFEETVKEKEPSSTVNTIDSAAITDYYLWRMENETLYQRMGEVRDRSDLEGSWVRILGGRNTLNKGKHYFKHEYYGIQLGLDQVFNKEDGGKWILGGGLTYTHGETDLRNGGDGKNWLGSISLYGVRKFDDGGYIDLIVKASKINHDYKAVSDQRRYISRGKYHTYALQASVEAGKKFMLNDKWYLDPQWQLSYGHIKGSGYRTDSEINVHIDGLDSLIGRAGLSLGRETREGSAFIKVDALREFTAEHKTRYSLDNGARNSSLIDLKDTWGEITVGGTYNFRKDTYGFAQIKRSFAADVEQEYRADIGIRYIF